MFESRDLVKFIFPFNGCLLLYALVVVGIHSGAQDFTPRYDTSICPAVVLVLAEDSGVDISCGRVLAPENRQAPDKGRRVNLFFLRIPPETESGNAPILHLSGGPGDPASADLRFWLESPLHQVYEIILVDQRGTGLSLPTLDCPEYGDGEDEIWIRACRQRLVEQGMDLSQFQYLSVVWDLHDLLVALELEHVNLYGNSYGSRLALMLSSIAPERIRSMVLDGVYPPPRNDLTELASNSARALERLFADCEADAACHELYPQLQDMFYQVVSKMNAAPPELYHLGESTGRTLNGDQFLAWTVGVMRYHESIPILPHLIASFDAGVYDLFILIDGLLKMPHWNDRDFRSEGFELSVRCSEDARYMNSEREGKNESTVSEAIARVIDPVVRHLRDQCELWNVPAAPGRVSRAVESDVPALLLSGAYDPATPPHWAQFAAEYLNRSWSVVFPHVGHGVLESDECAWELMRAWYFNPLQKPDAECYSTLGPPQFVEQDQDGG